MVWFEETVAKWMCGQTKDQKGEVGAFTVWKHILILLCSCMWVCKSYNAGNIKRTRRHIPSLSSMLLAL